MALEATFRALPISLRRLHDALIGLESTLGDKPQGGELAFADDLESMVIDLLGTLHDALRAGLNAQRALASPPDLDRARRALTLCQERFHKLEKQFVSGPASYEKLKELTRLAYTRPEWQPWAKTTEKGIEHCRHPLERTSKALAACWEELAERLGTVSFSVQTIGQQIKMPAGTKMPETEPIT